ncbi:LacI family DNA-binding transcriptional regulator [Sinisalibacter aestuarii]|uniref:HTH lacI-type domain-containing protein n=1 Tax=Sinisalibacter aestuarii TaxID=2949426 RepID=A0ABQ5LQP1_9RHOB|nr:substrate-binding domain-containing protein [Sinisalibacter aestuarii]GKY87327.1 hypothetical protein STA1M1_11960 [Sinisalibacter aestuarii]
MTGYRQYDRPQKPTRRVTISDVSDALGLTKSTVSRALNGYDDIAETTRLRVARMAERMGYRPMSQAQTIRTGRARALGLVVELSPEGDAHRLFLADFLAGLSQAAGDEGWTVTIAAADNQAGALDAMRALVRDRKADGFVLPRTLWDDPRVALLRREHVPFVLFGRVRDGADCAWHDVRGEEAMADAVARLVALGHRRIGFVNGMQHLAYCHHRRAGFLDGMAAAGLAADPALIVEGMANAGDAARATRALLDLPEPPTALIYATDTLALGAYRAARALGLELGRDLSVIGYDGLPEGTAVLPALASYAVDFRGVGQTLARHLIRRIEGDQPETLRTTIAAVFRDGGSIGAPALTPPELAARLRGRAAAPSDHSDET